MKRLILLAPSLALLAGGVAVLIAAPFAWGAAAHVEIPDWMTTAVGVIFALPAIVIGGLTVLQVWRRTGVEYVVARPQYAAGVVLVGVAALLFGLAGNIGEPSTYDNLRDPDGTINTTPAGFMVNAIVITVIATLVTLMFAHFHWEAIQREPRTKFDRKPGEPDPVGRMLRQEAAERHLRGEDR